MITLSANRCTTCQQVVDNSQGDLGAARKGKGKAVEGQQGNEDEDDDEEQQASEGEGGDVPDEEQGEESDEEDVVRGIDAVATGDMAKAGRCQTRTGGCVAGRRTRDKRLRLEKEGKAADGRAALI